MNGIIWVSIYLIIVFTVLLLRSSSFKRYNKKGIEICDSVSSRYIKKELVLVFFFSLLFMLVNVVCTKTSISFGSDRENYLFEFSGRRDTSFGLGLVFTFFRITLNRFEFVLYFTTFFCCFLVLIAHSFFEYNSTLSLFFILTTDFVFFTFTSLKQSYSCAFGALFFLMLTREKTIRRNIICLILILLASLFHSSSIILLPVLIICNNEKTTNLSLLVYFLSLVLFFIFFNNIGTFLSRLTRVFPSSISDLFTKYFVNVDSEDESSTIAFLKGAPFYYLFIKGCIHRKRIKKNCKNYDKYLIILATASALYMCSLYIYWAMRFRAFFYLPAAIFMNVLCRNVSSVEEREIEIVTIGMNLVLLIRWLYLVFVNYGGF